MRLLCGSINVRERPWASKRQPIDYQRCCTDRLNAHSQSGHAGSNLDTSALCQKRPNAAQQTAPLFDDFVCLSEQRRRKLEAERLGGREIYDEIKLSRLLDWDVARLGTVQNLVDIVCGAAVHVR